MSFCGGLGVWGGGVCKVIFVSNPTTVVVVVVNAVVVALLVVTDFIIFSCGQ